MPGSGGKTRAVLRTAPESLWVGVPGSTLPHPLLPRSRGARPGLGYSEPVTLLQPPHSSFFALFCISNFPNKLSEFVSEILSGSGRTSRELGRRDGPDFEGPHPHQRLWRGGVGREMVATLWPSSQRF